MEKIKLQEKKKVLMKELREELHLKEKLPTPEESY